MAKIGGQPNVEEWLDGETWRQAIDSGEEVYGKKGGTGVLQEAAEIAGEVVKDAMNNTANVVRDAGNAVENALRSLTRHLR